MITVMGRLLSRCDNCGTAGPNGLCYQCQGELATREMEARRRRQTPSLPEKEIFTYEPTYEPIVPDFEPFTIKEYNTFNETPRLPLEPYEPTIPSLRKNKQPPSILDWTDWEPKITPFKI